MTCVGGIEKIKEFRTILKNKPTVKKSILTFLISFIAVTTYCQNKEITQKLNLDFETLQNGKLTGWNDFEHSDYTLSLDSINVKSGKYAASIEFKEGNPTFKAWSFQLPNNYSGKKITLTGYIKTENVTNGYAGLWMRIDPSLGFENMSKNGIKGTTNWTQYSITLKLNPQQTEQIIIGGLLAGKGKVWFDKFNVTIDGTDIKDLKPFEKKLLPAEKDTEFDKGSRIADIPINKNQIENIKSLGLIWGFLKYYHPNIAKGEYNWDFELFRVLPKILNSESKKNRDEILIKWIENLGLFSESNKTDYKSSDVKIKPDLDWITASNFSEELATLLLKVKNANRPKEHFYIELQPAGNANFINENAYRSMDYADAGFRLLALYRYWNIIQYYFPYKNLIEEDWKNVLEEFIPKIIEANNETAYTLTLLELIGRVHDTHANIWGNYKALNNHFGLRFAAAKLTFIENKPVVTGFYDEKLGKQTGLEIGDVISMINNKPIEAIVKDRLKYAPASNYPTKLRNIAASLLRTNDSTIIIEFIKNDKVMIQTLKTFDSKEINLESTHQVSDTFFKLIDKDIAYIDNGSLKKRFLPKIWREIEKTKGVIIDIRNYPSDFPIYALSDYLLPRSTSFTKLTKGSIENPGLFTFTKPIKVGKRNTNYYKGKVVILVNEITQSSAEFHTMAYRVHPNTVVIGSTTAGADGNISQFYLPSGINTWISGIGVYYPDGKETQRIGIIPDIELKPTIRGIREKRDELLEKAIEIIDRK